MTTTARIQWLASHVALAILALALWDAYILKRLLDAPGLFVLGVALAFGLVVWIRAQALATEAAARGRLARAWARIERRDLVYLAYFCALFAVQNSAYMRAASDGRGYFLQVRSLLIDGDLDFTQDIDTFGYLAQPLHYALGTPILWMPFFLACHYWLGLRNLAGAEFARDGYFNPYQRAVGFGTLIYGMIGLLLIDRYLRRYLSAKLSLAATLVMATGGFVAWFMAVDSSWSHASSMMAVTAFLLFWDRRRERMDQRAWIVLGLLGGFMLMVRWQNIFFMAVPAAEALRGYAGAWQSRRRAAALVLLRHHVAFALATVVAFFPQMLVWRLGRGGWFDYPTDGHSIYWDAPHFWDALFHLDRGLFTWTPLLLFAVAGVLLYTRRHVWPGSLLLAVFVLQVYINGTIWWGEHGFGARRFANCAVILALGLGFFIDWCNRHPRVLTGSVLAVALTLNLFFMREVYLTDLQQVGAVRFGQMVESVTRRTGHPLSLPMNAWYAWRYGGDWTLYERIGSQTFNNVRIDVGEAGDDRFLARGWSDRERNARRSFRWSSGDHSVIVFQAKEKAAYRLRLECGAVRHPDGLTQQIDVLANGARVGRFDFDADATVVEIDLRAEIMRRRMNRIDLHYAWTVSPRELGRSDDPRHLALRCDRIELLR